MSWGLTKLTAQNHGVDPLVGVAGRVGNSIAAFASQVPKASALAESLSWTTLGVSGTVEAKLGTSRGSIARSCRGSRRRCLRSPGRRARVAHGAPGVAGRELDSIGDAVRILEAVVVRAVLAGRTILRARGAG
jgi:hypothetical protein